jgi:GNAT superfamily N-acetyltransferase
MTSAFAADLGEVLVRPGQAEDIDGMARVSLDTWKLAYTGILPDLYLERMRLAAHEAQRRRLIGAPGVRHFVAEEPVTGEIVGFASAGPARNGAFAAPSEIYELYVQNGFQGQGLGRSLFEASIRRLASEGSDSVLVWVLAENPSRGFYERLGGRLLKAQTIRVGGAPVEEVSYVWRDLRERF